jgi:DEAD/DEAH box helicase domain-containing protein
VLEATRLLALLVTHGVRTLAFVKARAAGELLLRRARQLLPACLHGRVACYRAGYTVADRRAVEAELRGGVLVGVVATNALELGIDIGGIAATLHLGCPGR